MAKKRPNDTIEGKKKLPRIRFSIHDDKLGGGGVTKRSLDAKDPVWIIAASIKQRSLRPSEKHGLSDAGVTLRSKEDTMNPEALKRATIIAKKYDVVVDLVDTDKEFYSDALILESIKNNRFFISNENPEPTSRITDLLIRYKIEHEKYQNKEAQDRKLKLLSIANEKRAQKSVQTAQDVMPRITEITKQYCDANDGKEPSLHKLAELLNDAKIPAPGGSQSKWFAQSVKRVMTNENLSHQK